MLLRTTPLSWLIVCALTCPSAVGQDQAPAPQEPFSLGEFARQQQLKKQMNSASRTDANRATQSATGVASGASDLDLDLYEKDVQALLVRKDFVELNKMGALERSTKARFIGGTWKLYVFYEALSTPPGGDKVPDSLWAAHLDTLKSWVRAQPASVTPRVALASAYTSFAWVARGSGFADTVTDRSWELMQERVAQAQSILAEAAKLKDKCPHWYAVMFDVALAQGWEKRKARALFDEAIAFEPAYYHYYRLYVTFLLPKWYGEDGEAEQFAEEVYNRIGGQQGEFVYFELATVINCQCGYDETHMARMSWPRIKKGYQVLQQLYGVSRLKRNRFAYLAYLAGDKPVAQQVFTEIAGGWDLHVWKTVDRFVMIKNWAFN